MTDAKPKRIKVPSVTHPTLCFKQPSLSGSPYNPMLHCNLPKGHKGKHSWERKRLEAPE